MVSTSVDEASMVSVSVDEASMVSMQTDDYNKCIKIIIHSLIISFPRSVCHGYSQIYAHTYIHIYIYMYSSH